jgi:hypothetical protein
MGLSAVIDGLMFGEFSQRIQKKIDCGCNQDSGRCDLGSSNLWDALLNTLLQITGNQ